MPSVHVRPRRKIVAAALAATAAGALLAGCGNLSTAKEGSDQACAALATKEPALTPMFTVTDPNATIAQADFALSLYQQQSDEIRAKMNSSQTQLLDRVVRAMSEYQSALAGKNRDAVIAEYASNLDSYEMNVLTNYRKMIDTIGCPLPQFFSSVPRT